MILCSNLGVKMNYQMSRKTENNLAWSGEQRALLCRGFSVSLSACENWLHAAQAEPRQGTWQPGLLVRCLWVLPEVGLKKTDDPSFNACLSGPVDYNEILLFYEGSPSISYAGLPCELSGFGQRWWMGVQPSPALHKLPSLQEPLQCRCRGYVASFYPLTNTVTKKPPVELW